MTWKEQSRKVAEEVLGQPPARDDDTIMFGYNRAISDFKSSIKRDIEKRIAELEKPIEFDLDEEVLEYMRYYSKIQIEECKRFLELIETVEP